MSYYNPIKWVGQNDNLLDEIEEKLIEEKTARAPRQSRGSKAFRPLNSIELDIEIKKTGESFRLALRENRIKKIFINLSSDHEIYRQGHYNTSWHHNPNGFDISPPHHVHFPTQNYPDLNRNTSYAYPIQAEPDYLDALRQFCTHVNIKISGVPLPLLRR